MTAQYFLLQFQHQQKLFHHLAAEEKSV